MEGEVYPILYPRQILGWLKAYSWKKKLKVSNEPIYSFLQMSESHF